MNPDPPSEYRPLVAKFGRKHRTGLVTILFTDIVGSTQLKQRMGDRQGVALLQKHAELVREILSGYSESEEISTSGDSFLILFATPSDAVKFAVTLQSRLSHSKKNTEMSLKDRVGIHVGEVVIEERKGSIKPKDLLGLQVDTCARVMSLAEGGQILMTRAVVDSARQVLKGEDIEEVSPLLWINHGPYVFKGVEEPLEVCEVCENTQTLFKAPASSEKAQRHVSMEKVVQLASSQGFVNIIV